MDGLRKKFYWLAILALLVFITDIYLNRANELELLTNTPVPQNPTSVSTATSESTSSNNKISENSEISKPAPSTPVKTDYLIENPETEEQKISLRAKTLKPTEIKILKENSLDTSLNQDQRFESIYLLSLSQKASKELEQVVLFPIPTTFKERMLDFENVLRAQAIEGIQNSSNKKQSIEILKNIINKTDNNFLLERSKRAQIFLENGGDSLEVQDKKQLEKVLGN